MRHFQLWNNSTKFVLTKLCIVSVKCCQMCTTQLAHSATAQSFKGSKNVWLQVLFKGEAWKLFLPIPWRETIHYIIMTTNNRQGMVNGQWLLFWCRILYAQDWRLPSPYQDAGKIIEHYSDLSAIKLFPQFRKIRATAAKENREKYLESIPVCLKLR